MVTGFSDNAQPIPKDRKTELKDRKSELKDRKVELEKTSERNNYHIY